MPSRSPPVCLWRVCKVAGSVGEQRCRRIIFFAAACSVLSVFDLDLSALACLPAGLPACLPACLSRVPLADDSLRGGALYGHTHYCVGPAILVVVVRSALSDVRCTMVYEYTCRGVWCWFTETSGSLSGQRRSQASASSCCLCVTSTLDRVDRSRWGCGEPWY